MLRHYNEEELLPLSGIQHFAFCERQWGLIHVENQWVENIRTAEGRIMHQRVDDPFYTETRGDAKTVRSVPLISKTLGLYGVADVLELQKIPNHETTYNIIEYKRGRPKLDDRDEVQLCAQAFCLEEMLGITLPHGYLFYGETKHRHRVVFDKGLRGRVESLAARMHFLYARGETPPAVKDKRCKNCSLAGICLPKLNKSNKKIEAYLNSIFDESAKDLSSP